MSKHRIVLLACFLCLVFIVSIPHAQQFVPIEQPADVIRLYNENVPDDVDLETYIETGEIKLLGGIKLLPPKIKPGPAPTPYPHIHVWEREIAQLGESAAAVDGIWFINGNLWHPKKWALVRWNIRVPNSDERLPNEFEEDFTVSLFVDWNQDRTWSKNELVLREHINIHEHFPHIGPEMEISYLTMFRIPEVQIWNALGNGSEKYTTKVWVRGVLSYDDPDCSADGESLFGEYEDYEISYFEQQHGIKKVD
jgi:hypothetical protein